ncbi:hypothetical protein P3T73_12110 [Kiritimatiellota bacterium B12222]|nr:hypothetical protein P3T73_12110 [Kiritimatiellota bacterium B12222]
MSDRLTYTPQSKNEQWPQLTFPLMMLLTALALIPLTQIQESDLFRFSVAGKGFLVSLEALALLVVMAQSGLLVRKLIPAKSAANVKAFAGVSGMGLPFIFLQGFIPFFENPFLNYAGAAFMLSSWIFCLYANEDSWVWVIASGLTMGIACFIFPVCFSGAIALLFYRFLFVKQPLKAKALNAFLWTLAVICGLSPALTGNLPVPAYATEVFSTEFMKGGLNLLIQNAPIWSWGFILIAFVVAILQKQKILLCLIFPYLVIRIICTGFLPVELLGVESTLLLPLAWFTAYGMLRIVRGLEQGVRKVNPALAKRIPTIATVCFIVGFLVKIADVYWYSIHG